MWQKCPICEGSGKSPLTQNEKCKICDGKGIIDSNNGTPPSQVNESNKPKQQLIYS